MSNLLCRLWWPVLVTCGVSCLLSLLFVVLWRCERRRRIIDVAVAAAAPRKRPVKST